MSFLNSAYNELVYGGHLLALGTASIAATASIMLGVSPPITLLLIAYLFTFAAYNLNRAWEVDQDLISHPQRTAFVTLRRRIYQSIVPVYFLTGFLLALIRNFYFFLVLLAPLALSELYSVGSARLTRVLGATRFKDKLVVKNVTIAGAWSLIPLIVCAYFPRIAVAPLLLAPFIFLRLFSNTVFFDIRDVDADASYGTRTIPAIYGVRAANIFMQVTDVMALGYIILVSVYGLVPHYSVVLAVFPVYSFVYRHVSKFVDKNVIRDLIADGEFLLWAPVLYLAKL